MNSIEACRNLFQKVNLRLHAGDEISLLNSVPFSVLKNELADVNIRKAFWLNFYNAYSQILLQQLLPNLENPFGRLMYFNSRKIPLAGKWISLNTIEHGMLRGNRLSWHTCLSNPFADNFTRSLSVPADFRIHFALNCGARSCPIIHSYESEALDFQLTESMKQFLQQDAMVNSEKAVVSVNELLKWFACDFGGETGIRDLLKQSGLISAHMHFTITYHRFDWKIMSANFQP